MIQTQKHLKPKLKTKRPSSLAGTAHMNLFVLMTVHNCGTIQNSADNLPSYLPDNHHS